MTAVREEFRGFLNFREEINEIEDTHDLGRKKLMKLRTPMIREEFMAP